MFENMTVVEVSATPSPFDSVWSSLGFATEAEFKQVQNRVDLIVTWLVYDMRLSDDIARLGEILEHSAGMDVIVMIAATRYVNILEIVQSMPIVEWLGACVLIWRRVAGGVAISHGRGIARSQAAGEMAALMTAADIRVAACGVGCLAGPGPVAIPFGSGPFVLLAAPGVELGGSLRENSLVVAAVLVDAQLRRIPDGSFARCDNLSLVALPSECAVIGWGAFRACEALTGIDLENVEVLKTSAFDGCFSLSHMGAHSRLRSIGGLAFHGAATAELGLGSVSRVGCWAFLASALRVFSGQVKAWGDCPFENCANLQRLEMWPGQGFDPLHLVGHVPGDIRFHGVLRDAEKLFARLLQGSCTPLVITADGGRIIGGPGSSLAGQRRPDRVRMTLPDFFERKDLTMRAVHLSGLMPGSLRSTMAGSIWVETVTLPSWVEEMPMGFFMDCLSLKAVNLEGCWQLRKIGTWCFCRCVSLSALGFPDSLSSVSAGAFAASGLEALDFAHAKGLIAVGVGDAHWLAGIRLPFRLRAVDDSAGACRIVDASCGVWDMSSLRGRMRRFRSSAVRGPDGEPSRCLVSACVTAELAAAGGRSSAPALPC
jgi:hypothetical protein